MFWGKEQILYFSWHGRTRGVAQLCMWQNLVRAKGSFSECCCRIVPHHSLYFQFSEWTRIRNSILLSVDLKWTYLMFFWAESCEERPPHHKNFLILCAVVQEFRTNLQESKENVVVQWSWMIISIVFWTTFGFLNVFSCLQFFWTYLKGSFLRFSEVSRSGISLHGIHESRPWTFLWQMTSFTASLGAAATPLVPGVLDNLGRCSMVWPCC